MIFFQEILDFTIYNFLDVSLKASRLMLASRARPSEEAHCKVVFVSETRLTDNKTNVVFLINHLLNLHSWLNNNLKVNSTCAFRI